MLLVRVLAVAITGVGLVVGLAVQIEVLHVVRNSTARQSSPAGRRLAPS